MNHVHSEQCTRYTVQNFRNRNYLIDCYSCCSSDNWLSKIARSVFSQFCSTTRCVFPFLCRVHYTHTHTLHLSLASKTYGTQHTLMYAISNIYQLKSQKFCLYFHVSTVLFFIHLFVCSFVRLLG